MPDAHVGVGGMHPQLAAAGVDDARGLPVVVGVRVRADEQPHVAEPQPAWAMRALELASEPGSCSPQSNSTTPSPAATA